ncbi:MAG: phosphatidate cytidylyltransferase, partial [Bacteroidota bacterium]
IAGTVTMGAIIYSPYGFWLFCVIVSLVGVWEFMSVMGVGFRRYKWLTVLGLGGIWLLELVDLILFDMGMGEIPAKLMFAAMILLLPVAGLLALFNAKEKEPIQQLSVMMLAGIYVFIPLYLFYDIAVPAVSSDYNFWLPLGILLLTWVLDSFAYFSGRLFGKHPLFPRISPKKTWEGATGGAVCSLILAGVFATYLPEGPYSWWVIGGIIVIFSQLGDLMESMFKRSRQLKDSGSILPGHGGMLDRFDGIFVSIPFIFFYFSLL